MRKIGLILVALLATTFLYAQKVKSVIPYTVLGGKMIVEVTINGVLQRAIFDTGGRTMITSKLMRELGLSVTDSLEVTDVNSSKAYYKMATVKSILLGEKGVHFSGFSALIAPDPSPFECFGTEVLLGSELLANAILEIDHKAKTIAIMSAEVPSKASLRSVHSFSQSGTMPILSLSIGGMNVPVLFDTGFGGFLSLKKSDYQTIGLLPISEAIAEGSIGMAGKAETSIAHRVKIHNISIGGSKFKNVVTETGTPPFTLLGMRLLDYAKVTIDYPRGRVYVEAYEKENDLSRVVNDYSLSVRDGKLVVSTVWTSMRGVLEDGDIVTHINGKPVKQYDFCESIITGIPELKVKKKTILTVETKKGIQKVTLLNNK